MTTRFGQLMDRLEGMAAEDGQAAQEANGATDETKHRPSQATRLVEITHNAQAELWRDPEHNSWTTIPVEGHREHWQLRGVSFKRWVSQQFYLAESRTPAAQALQDALGVLEGEAIFSGPEHRVHTRVAEHNGIIYLDLANQTWEVVEITPAGWQVVSNLPVKFRRSRGMLPLPHPVAGGSIEELRPFVNVSSDAESSNADWFLVLSWIVAALRGVGPFPVLTIHGEQGSAKSTTERVFRMLVDPNVAPLRAEPRDGRDLMIAATNSWVMALDNLSHLPAWISDALCRLATGGGFATRELYTDADEVLFNGQRPVILNGIEELTARGDLLDRSIVLHLPPIPEGQRRPEAKFWVEFEKARPRILGALLDGVSHGLANVGQVSLDQLPRMADFAVWTCAVAPALGFTQEEFLDAYTRNRTNAHSQTLEASSVYGPLTALLMAKDWEGTATALLGELEILVDEKTRRLKGWPSNGRALSNALRRLAPNLRAIGIEVSHATPHGKRLISLQAEILRSQRSTVPPATTDGESGTQTSPSGTQNNPPVKPSQIQRSDGNAHPPTHSNGALEEGEI